jgi:hypothetical protein
MLEYLEKFNNLPAEVKQKISSGAVMAALDEMEGEYGLDLATFVMRVMVGELYYKNLVANLIIEYDIEPEVAGRLAKDLQNKIFDQVADYLNAVKAPAAAKQPEASSPFFGNKAQPAAAVASAQPAVRRAPASSPTPVNYLEEDKADIAAAGKITTNLKTVTQEKSGLILQEIIKEAKLGFASETLLRRFQEILLSYLRGVRTKVEVRENLLKDFASGGVKMSEVEADRILNIAQKKLTDGESKFPASPGKVTAKSTSSGTSFIFNEEEIKQALAQRGGSGKSQSVNSGVSSARDVDYDLKALKNRPPVVSDTSAVSLTGKSLPQAAAKDISAAAVPPAPLPEVPPAGNMETPDIASLRDNESKRTAAAVGNKKRMDDIKPSPRIMSPIDELAYMDLVNFRRLDPSPAKRAAKIEEKIALLEKEGIDKKIEGIRVWRLNPVSKTYLSMGQESISSGKTIDDIIKERKDQGLNYLSQEEFEAVMDLNNNLRF